MVKNNFTVWSNNYSAVRGFCSTNHSGTFFRASFRVTAIFICNSNRACALDSLDFRKNKQIYRKQTFFRQIAVDYLLPSFFRFRKNYLAKGKIRWNKFYIFNLIDSHVIHYPTPLSLTYAWSFGSLAGVSLVIQIITGLFLAMHYTPDIHLAFDSVEYIMRDVPNGWFLRYTHSNGASMFFIVVYGHMCRGLYYGSYMKPREWVWVSGVVLFILMMGAAFSGYVLPWGQMSLWGATVITSMVTVVPIGGRMLVEWLWGGYTVNNPTLRRFFVLHFVLPFIIVGITFIHLALLHKVGSNTPIGSDSGVDDVPFYPYFVTKDMFALSIYGLLFTYLVCFEPNLLSHPDNYVPADPSETPPHVVPEWYFLPFYAILRSIPHKAGGIFAMLGAILVLFIIPFTNTSYVRSTTFRPIFKFFFWAFIYDIAMLFWIGQRPIKDCYMYAGQAFTVYYYVFFVVSIPVVGRVENFLGTYKIDVNQKG